MQYTENLKLAKPEGTDVPDITVMSANMEIIDAEMKEVQDELGKAAQEETLTEVQGTMAQEETLQSVKSTMAKEETLAEVLSVLKDKTPKRYGVRIKKNESNPAARIEYIYDAVGMTPAKMNFTSGTFDYGDWADIWFVKDNYPVMVTSTGEEDYLLDPNDYSLKLNGAASDVANTAYDGNAMAAMPLVWISRWEDANYEYIAVCESQYDESYRADAHTNEAGEVMDKFYAAIFRGSLVDNKLRSISGLQPMYSKTAQNEIDYAKANGALWDIDTFSRYNLLADLMTIISKSDNSQASFGNGNLGYNESLAPTYGVMVTGTLNNKGQFWGANDNTHQMKAFHIEAVYADQWRRVRGLIYDYGEIKIKPTAPYNLTGDGYFATGIHILNASGVAQAGTDVNGYIKGTKMTRYGRLPVQLGGSSATYTCDYLWSRDDIVAVGLVGGACHHGSYCGVRCVALDATAGHAWWNLGAALSCEPPSALV
ncbi:MAG: hypothetical protein IJF50_03360 [Peptococcaceae bacterium]|nr:hypothetical protein [Peptococcaceae bacterium]